MGEETERAIIADILRVKSDINELYNHNRNVVERLTRIEVDTGYIKSAIDELKKMPDKKRETGKYAIAIIGGIVGVMGFVLALIKIFM